MNDYQQGMTAFVNAVQNEDDASDVVRSILESAVNAGDLYKFLVGDVMTMYLETVQHGHKREMKQWFANVSGLNYNTLESYITVCRFWRPSTRFRILERYPNITFSYLKEAVSYGREYSAVSAFLLMREAQSVPDLKRLFASKRGVKPPATEGQPILETELWIEGGANARVYLGDYNGLIQGKRYNVSISEN